MTSPEQSNRNVPRSDLLDELTRLAGCEFLSDLPQPKWRGAVCRALGEIDPGSFSIQAWQDSAAYFCGAKLQFHTAGEARDALLAALKADP